MGKLTNLQRITIRRKETVEENGKQGTRTGGFYASVNAGVPRNHRMIACER